MGMARVKAGNTDWSVCAAKETLSSWSGCKSCSLYEKGKEENTHGRAMPLSDIYLKNMKVSLPKDTYVFLLAQHQS